MPVRGGGVLHQRILSGGSDPYAASKIYYGPDREASVLTKARTLSSVYEPGRPYVSVLRESVQTRRPRRGSHDEAHQIASRRYLVNIDATLEDLLRREDTDNNFQITIDDKGPKVYTLGTYGSRGFNKGDVRGNYMTSNLLQELTLAKDYGRKLIVLDEVRLLENPVDRLARSIQFSFWDSLTRRIDKSSIEVVARDIKDWTDDPRPRIYVPRGAPDQFEYYSKLAESRPELRFDVQWLPSGHITGEFVRDLNNNPGLLAVDMEEYTDEETGARELRGKPFVVPGGRFNELYGWDSYMESVGLLLHDRIDLAKPMVEHFCFCIKHYGKILNANRSYYLGRSQPPFLTDMALRVYERIKAEAGALDFLRTATLAAMKEYHGVWMADPRLDRRTGLSRYRPDGVGVPPETEADHFMHYLQPFAEKYGMKFTDFVRAYNYGKIKEPELDEYFLHDRAVRESGHDTSYRLEKVAANLATIDLNSLLFKYETDIANILRTHFNDRLDVPAEWSASGFEPGYTETSSMWDRRAKKRRAAVDKHCWSETAGMYFDYNTATKEISTYETCTTFWTLWSGIATPDKASRLVKTAVPKFEVFGGLVSGTEESRGPVGFDRPNRQWDFPFGWAPQQILAWQGLARYHYEEEAQRLAYRWLYMVTKAFFDFNGVVVEKYNVTRPVDPHKVDAEYGNQGSDFKGVAKEGFGWVNASYAVGLSMITAHMRRALGALTPWETFARMTAQGLDSADEDDDEGDVQTDAQEADMGAIETILSAAVI